MHLVKTILPIMWYIYLKSWMWFKGFSGEKGGKLGFSCNPMNMHLFGIIVPSTYLKQYYQLGDIWI